MWVCSCEAALGFAGVSNVFGLPLPPDHVDAPPSSFSSLHFRLDDNTQCLRLDGRDLVSLEGTAHVQLQQGQVYEEPGLRLHWRAKALLQLLGRNQREEAEEEGTFFQTFAGPEEEGATTSRGSSEQGLDILRGLNIHHSMPFPGLGSPLTQLGTHTVAYTLRTPWLLPHAARISLVRRVSVADVDECTYTGNNSMFRAACVPPAACVNTPGSYKCVCPEGFSGEGGEDGGGGAVMTVCRKVAPPHLRCQGLGCRGLRLTALNYSGLVGLGLGLGGSGRERGRRVSPALQLPFTADSAGAVMTLQALQTFLEEHKHELCGLPPTALAEDDPLWDQNDCFFAFDYVHRGATRARAEEVDSRAWWGPEPSHSMSPSSVPSTPSTTQSTSVPVALSRVSLTSRVRMGAVTVTAPAPREERGRVLCFRIPCYVQDEAGACLPGCVHAFLSPSVSCQCVRGSCHVRRE
jgi:hypothetical protein